MKFHIEEVYDVPIAVFEDVTPSHGSVLSSFLSDAENSIDDFLNEVAKAERNEDVPTGYICNGVDVSFYPDRAEIEERYPMAGEPQKAVIPLAQAKQLLLEWQAALDKWYAERQVAA